ncbi:hypothetical protein FRACYDRAFT_245160 [Fragilariopsis cylindrus CCMP1102]|uniref:Uncharacterized protein n=1 Tax=Fragilariopsis cylindrus CCMP1102 TaxID=635003 RepID=A0A1E7F2I2_9STRA|nr:hypothetical protein FRACYDRAFT_245160 [Fragilariopsis cylindrus CCMP1102]|eukprot:OEU12033.1 hypothetical protein FRACYDRAFT_245160 [Fragilariopsis cylindrus CCMP1102]
MPEEEKCCRNSNDGGGSDNNIPTTTTTTTTTNSSLPIVGDRVSLSSLPSSSAVRGGEEEEHHQQEQKYDIDLESGCGISGSGIIASDDNGDNNNNNNNDVNLLAALAVLEHNKKSISGQSSSSSSSSTNAIPIAYEVNNATRVYEYDDNDDDVNEEEQQQQKEEEDIKRISSSRNKRSKWFWCCSCIVIVLLLALLIPLIIFTKEVKESREIATAADKQRNSQKQTGSSAAGQKPSSIEYCQNEIVLLDPKTGRDLITSSADDDGANNVAIAGCYTSTDDNSSSSVPSKVDDDSTVSSVFDIRFRRCPPYNNNDWIGLFPSKASTLSRLWTSNLQGTYLCGNEPCSSSSSVTTERTLIQGNNDDSDNEDESQIIMRKTAIVPTLGEEISPGLYRFFLVKGDSIWPYEYITYTDPFLVVKNLNDCNASYSNNNDNDKELFGNDPTNSNVFNPEETAATNDDDLSGWVDNDKSNGDDEDEWVEETTKTTESPSVAWVEEPTKLTTEKPWIETTATPLWNYPTYVPTDNDLTSSSNNGMKNTIFATKWWIQLSNRERTAAETIGYSSLIWDTVSTSVRNGKGDGNGNGTGNGNGGNSTMMHGGKTFAVMTVEV